MAKKVTLSLLRLILSGLFLFAAASKLPNPTATHLAVYQYQLLSWELSEAFALLLPWLEITLAIGLWIPRVRLGASALTTVLFLLFLFALGSAAYRNLDINCGCFGASNARSDLTAKLLQNFLFTALSTILLRDEIRSRQDRLQLAPHTAN